MNKQRPTAAQEILLAASDLAAEGRSEFTEWDLTVAAWKRNQNKFGARGYEDKYPDHKRVMMEIMAKNKKDSPLRQGWIEKVRANYYRVTPLGLAEAQKLKQLGGEASVTVRSAQPVYEAAAPYVLHPVFRKYLEDPTEPKTWLGAEAFLGLTQYDAMALDDKLRSIENAAKEAVQWMEDTKQNSLRSGATGGKRALLRGEIERLPEFIKVLEARFSVQMCAIRKRA